MRPQVLPSASRFALAAVTSGSKISTPRKLCGLPPKRVASGDIPPCSCEPCVVGYSPVTEATAFCPDARSDVTSAATSTAFSAARLEIHLPLAQPISSRMGRLGSSNICDRRREGGRVSRARKSTWIHSILAHGALGRPPPPRFLPHLRPVGRREGDQVLGGQGVTAPLHPPPEVLLLLPSGLGGHWRRDRV